MQTCRNAERLGAIGAHGIPAFVHFCIPYEH